jgi:hypothetical protein
VKLSWTVSLLIPWKHQQGTHQWVSMDLHCLLFLDHLLLAHNPNQYDDHSSLIFCAITLKYFYDFLLQPRARRQRTLSQSAAVKAAATTTMVRKMNLSLNKKLQLEIIHSFLGFHSENQRTKDILHSWTTSLVQLFWSAC